MGVEDMLQLVELLDNFRQFLATFFLARGIGRWSVRCVGERNFPSKPTRVSCSGALNIIYSSPYRLLHPAPPAFGDLVTD